MNFFPLLPTLKMQPIFRVIFGAKHGEYTQSLIQAPHISNTFETGQNLGKIKQSTGVFKKKIEKISNNSNTSKQR